MIKNPFSLSADQLQTLLKYYTSWSLTDPEGDYIQRLKDLSQKIKNTFLNSTYLDKVTDEQLKVDIKKYIRKLEGPVGIKLGDKRISDNLKALKKDFRYLIDTNENPYQVAYSLLEGEKKLKNFSKAFWSPIIQTRFPDEIPNWNNKTERFFKKLGVNIKTTKLNTREKIEKLSNGFKFLHQIEPELDFFQINHLMHYGTEVEEGTTIIEELIQNQTPATANYKAPLKIYKISESASPNSEKLFSQDKRYFYWNQKMFRTSEIGDPVIIINKTKRFALYTKIAEKEIASNYDSSTKTTSFSHKGETYKVDKKFEDFVQFEIIQQEEIPSGWKWTKSIGVGETYGLWTQGISSIQDRIDKIDDLLLIFQEGEANSVLEYYKSLLKSENPLEPEPPEPKSELAGLVAIESEQHWIDDALNDLKKDEYNHIITWWSAPPSGGKKVIDLISQRIKQDQYFDFYLGSDNEAKYRFKVEDFAIDPKEYTDKNWNFNKDVAWFQENFNDYHEEGRNHDPKIIFLVSEITKLEKPISFDDFEYYQSYTKPNRFNLQPFVSYQQKAVMKKTTVPQPIEIIKGVHKYIQGQGFNYDIKEIANFYLSLKTKPFVILAGISGTGKTKLVELFAEAIGYGDNEHCVIIPVKPDWTDNSDLLGYTNLNKEFEKKKLTEVILAAHKNPNEPYFVVLDEMNLARVEHYFSDFLSIIETRKIEEDGFSTKPLLSGNDVGEKTNERDKLVDLQIPQNLFIIGTVNMDETTFPFSKKVLDRANSIEMNQVKLDFIDKPENVEPLQEIYSDFLISDKISSKHLYAKDLEFLNKNGFIKELKDINEIQTNADLQFAYRVRDEIAFYLLNSVEVEDILSWEEAFDYQVMQKILPRIQGSALSINHLLINLINHFMGIDKFETKMHYEEDIKKELQEYIATNPKYIRTLSKLDFMLRKYSQDGFTSFWI